MTEAENDQIIDSEKKEQNKHRLIRFIGFKPSFFVYLVLFAGICAFIVWKKALLIQEIDGKPSYMRLIIASLYVLAIGFFTFFRFDFSNRKAELAFNIFMTVICGFFSYYCIEILAFDDIIKEHIQGIFVNWGIILVIYLLGYVIFNRFSLAVLFGSLICFALAVTNHLVFIFRGTPFLPNDVYAWGTAMTVIGQMKYVISGETILGALSFILTLAIAKGLNYRNDRFMPQFIAKAAGLAVVAYLTYAFTMTQALLYTGLPINYWNPRTTANDAGELVQILVYISKSRIEKPEDYSGATVKAIEEKYPDTEDTGSNTRANVIVIMNEAFSDLSVIKDFRTTEEVFPFISKLTENTIKGNMIASIKGGGTCNTEFEFLTGGSLGFYPGSYMPFQQGIKQKTPSIASVMSNQGYKVFGAHPYHATGWRRSTVYPLLGMETFYSLEDWPSTAQKGRLRLITDRANYQFLIDRFNEKEKDERMFIFNVTMQNHSGYSPGYKFPVEVTLPDYQSEEFENAPVYLSLMRQSDQAFKYLVEYFSKVDEPTIILMFGDHQPGDMNAFLDELSKDLDLKNLEDLSKLYTVPYILWTNYEIDKTFDIGEYVSCNYLSSFVMKLAGIDLPGYNEFLLKLNEEFPVLSAKIVIDKEGNYMTFNEAMKRSEMVRQYEILQYNDLFDVPSRNSEYFFGKASA
ncbi:MAG: LTA synthase family protein [Clostridia bacterium]|nr:LTA synthase family protein [Clostridia bacterium]